MSVTGVHHPQASTAARSAEDMVEKTLATLPSELSVALDFEGEETLTYLGDVLTGGQP
ncbi:hypothetical protein [Nocardiopsis nanhaiensis]